jgi:DNA-directed RNA polymerase specialized sigma24 family protein
MLYTRIKHGHLPVEVTAEGYRIVRESGVETYPNAHQMLLSLYGGKFVGMTFSRYFRQGRYAPNRPKLQLRPALVLSPAVQLTKGIDLSVKGREVSKLLQASCGKLIRSYGYEFDDVLQEVYRGILIRNQGAGAWDVSKSSFGTYVTMVCRCVFSNFHRHTQRLRSRETVGIRVCTAEGMTDTDASEVAISQEGSLASDVEVWECIADLADHIREGTTETDTRFLRDVQIAQRALPLVFAGNRRGEIARTLAVSTPTVGRALAYLRQRAGDWVASPGGLLYRR